MMACARNLNPHLLGQNPPGGTPPPPPCTKRHLSHAAREIHVWEAEPGRSICPTRSIVRRETMLVGGSYMIDAKVGVSQILIK